MARLSEYDFELGKEICSQIADGFGILQVLKSQPHYPAFSTWCRWVDNNEELRKVYHASLKNKAHAKESKYEQYMTDLESGKLDAHAAKVLLDATRWQMATLNAKIYGPKSGLIADGDEVSGISIIVHKKEEE